MSNNIVFAADGFEYEVREKLDKPDRPITAEDISSITELDCTNFDFYHEDAGVLEQFVNLETLSIDICCDSLSFLSSLLKLRELFIIYRNGNGKLDFSAFACLDNLESLWVSGGDISNIDFVNTESLIGLKKLTSLELHEFGTVDLSFLEQMPWLEWFSCRYADKIINVDSIGKLRNLKELWLDGDELDDLDFLDHFPDSLKLNISGNKVYKDTDINRLKRFTNADISDLEINGRLYFPFWL